MVPQQKPKSMNSFKVICFKVFKKIAILNTCTKLSKTTNANGEKKKNTP